MKLLFLDIDGVLNAHEFNEGANSNMIRKDKVDLLNQVLDRTGCHLVISSAWRYIVLREAMTVLGFEYLLRTHGIHCSHKLDGVTWEDSYKETRADLILAYIEESVSDEEREGLRWVAVDDLDLKLPAEHFVRTDGTVGLTQTHVNRLIELLGIN